MPVLLDARDLVGDFSIAADELGIGGWPCSLQAEFLPAPHRSGPLRRGCGAVYAFALAQHTTAAAGAGMVLKVGKAGANSNARFQSQHYGLSAPSTLARSILGHRIVWPWLGIDALDASNVRAWMLANLDRLNIFVPATSPLVLAPLEMYVSARIGSVFEGSAWRPGAQTSAVAGRNVAVPERLR